MGSMRVQSSLTITQGVGHGFYEGVELFYRYRGSRRRALPGCRAVGSTRR